MHLPNQAVGIERNPLGKSNFRQIRPSIYKDEFAIIDLESALFGLDEYWRNLELYPHGKDSPGPLGPKNLGPGDLASCAMTCGVSSLSRYDYNECFNKCTRWF